MEAASGLFPRTLHSMHLDARLLYKAMHDYVGKLTIEAAWR